VSGLYTAQRIGTAEVFAGMGDVGGGTTHLVTGANSVQANQTSTGAIRQTHLVGGAASVQANACSAGSVTQDATHYIGAAHSVQGNAASAGAVRQAHLVGGASSVVSNRASSGSAGHEVAVVLGWRSTPRLQINGRPRQLSTSRRLN
jgi:hypothetical protein